MHREAERVGRARGGAIGCAIAALTLAPTVASAAYIAPASGGDGRIDEVRIAYVSTPGRAVLFEQLSLADVRGETAWVVPVPEGGFVEPAGVQLFSALESASAPVFAPAPSLQCGALVRSTADELAAYPPRPIARSLGLSLAREAPDKLSVAGFVPSDATRKALLALGTEPVMILVLAPWVSGSTAAIRIVSGPRATVPLGLPGPNLRFFGLASGRTHVGAEIEPAFGALTWGAAGTNWPSLLDAARKEATTAGGQVVTFAAREGIFSDQALTAGATLPSVLRRYYGEAEACTKRAASLALRAEPLEVPCPRAPTWSGATPVPACSPTKAVVDDLVCEGADDLAAAFANSAPAQLWLTRFVGPVGEPLAPSVSAASASLPSFHQVSLPGTPNCEATPPPATTTPPPVTSPANPPPAATPPVVDDHTAEACGVVASGLAEGCAASAADGGCSGSSEGSSEDSASGCSGSDTGSSDGTDGCHLSTRRVRLRAWPLAYGLVALAFFARRRGRRGP